ncbi:hypothetical protein H5P28_18530 [Ruficoccus amylovorans]|uniref:Uncharacterized protein n=1 Tax=Ruficoccus amylovorans TaxID=1804625 RepID=A0A842HJH2_9BACT|nr:hypothetical protein [Ruficoccus amylovorans]MBC2596270.1 hypothetical protein [Ruficoccus amylovorans]
MSLPVISLQTIRNRLKAGRVKPLALDYPVELRPPPIDIRMMDSVLYRNGKESVALFCRGRKKALYRVRLWLDGEDLPQLARVCYRFPTGAGLPDIPMPRTVENVRCETHIWTGELLEIVAELTLKDGRSYHLRHELAYGQELKGARTTFVEVAATGL